MCRPEGCLLSGHLHTFAEKISGGHLWIFLCKSFQLRLKVVERYWSTSYSVYPRWNISFMIMASQIQYLSTKQSIESNLKQQCPNIKFKTCFLCHITYMTNTYEPSHLYYKINSSDCIIIMKGLYWWLFTKTLFRVIPWTVTSGKVGSTRDFHFLATR